MRFGLRLAASAAGAAARTRAPARASGRMREVMPANYGRARARASGVPPVVPSPGATGEAFRLPDVLPGERIRVRLRGSPMPQGPGRGRMSLTHTPPSKEGPTHMFTPRRTLASLLVIGSLAPRRLRWRLRRREDPSRTPRSSRSRAASSRIDAQKAAQDVQDGTKSADEAADEIQQGAEDLPEKPRTPRSDAIDTVRTTPTSRTRPRSSSSRRRTSSTPHREPDKDGGRGAAAGWPGAALSSAGWQALRRDRRLAPRVHRTPARLLRGHGAERRRRPRERLAQGRRGHVPRDRPARLRLRRHARQRLETSPTSSDNGRICVMFAAFEGPPKIVRLHGTGPRHPAGRR